MQASSHWKNFLALVFYVMYMHCNAHTRVGWNLTSNATHSHVKASPVAVAVARTCHARQPALSFWCWCVLCLCAVWWARTLQCKYQSQMKFNVQLYKRACEDVSVCHSNAMSESLRWYFGDDVKGSWLSKVSVNWVSNVGWVSTESSNKVSPKMHAKKVLWKTFTNIWLVRLNKMEDTLQSCADRR